MKIMIDQIEDFMNKLTDMDSGWFPVLFLRPAKDKDIDDVILLKLSLVFGSAFGVILLWLEFTRGRGIGLGSLVFSAFSGWVIFFMLYKFTFASFWNRRARRLRTEGNQNIPITKTPTVSSLRAGMNLGRKTGLIVSSLYATIGFFVIELLGIGAGFSSPYFYTSFPTSFPWGGFIITIIIIMLIAVVPATIIGGLTGACLGVLTEKTRGYISKYHFVLLCVTSCLVVIILIHLLFQIPISLSFEISNTEFPSLGIYESYPFCLGIPSVIYIITGGWTGWKLYSKAFITDGLE
jgi:hypothetical protein